MDFVVTRAPLRVSFAGGGTDLPDFYRKEYGAVLSATIDKHVYVMINRCRPILRQGVDDQNRYKIRLSYSSTENVQSLDELRHPIVREALRLMDLDIPMDIATMADVPAGTGLGSSGSFAVAFLHALHLIKEEDVSPDQLAEEAAHVEIDVLGRPVGKQDHYAAAFGGMNMIRFLANGDVTVRPVGSTELVQEQLFSQLMLLYTGVSRDASEILTEQVQNIDGMSADLVAMREHAVELEEMIAGGLSTQSFGKLLHKTWVRKRRLATTITNDRIDKWYDSAIEAGAWGGKICGAGGGGFLMLVVDADRQDAVREALGELQQLHIEYQPEGCKALLRTDEP